MAEYGILSYGAYIPRLRLAREAIALAHEWMAPSLKRGASGTRAFAAWDEDSITMAVEAARDAAPAPGDRDVEALTLASTTFPYADLQNAAIVAMALGLPSDLRTSDEGSSQRAGVAGLARALAGGSPALFIASDKPCAKPASPQEMLYGAGAVAFRLGTGPVIATLESSASITSLFVDHFRSAESRYDYYWEERWVRDEGYSKLIPRAVQQALEKAGLEISDIDQLVFGSPLAGGAKAVARAVGFDGVITGGLDSSCGYAGVAQSLLLLALALETAKPGQRIMVIGFGAGAEALILRVGDGIEDLPKRRGVSGSLANDIVTHAYLKMLSSYGELSPDWGMRAEKDGKAALTTLYREQEQLLTFNAGRCDRCGTVQFPQLAYCVKPGCGAPSGHFQQISLADEAAMVVTVTADWLSFHPSPPLYVGLVQFDAGARVLMEVVDVGPNGVRVGARVRPVFRIKEPDRVRHFNRYFWKASPMLESGD
jgi:3-hydroxy-3-methylglutaryl CoA synthase/uncharacterized OB-fold protein